MVQVSGGSDLGSNVVIAKAAVKADSVKDSSALLGFAKNWPAAAQKEFENSLTSKKEFMVLFVGSSADKTAARAAAGAMEKAFAGSPLKTSVVTSELTSTEFVTQKKPLELAAVKAQLIILEPFVLNDNGKVETKTALGNLSKIIEDVQSLNPTASFVLQPSYPLFDAKFYPLQVDALKKYAQDKGIAYLDHWKSWPDTQDADLKNFLLPDQSGPNDKGNAVWAQYLEDYLIRK